MPLNTIADNATDPASYGAPSTVSSPTIPVLDTQLPRSDFAAVPVAQKRPFYKQRRFIILPIALISLTIALLFIILFPVFRAIVALVLHRSNLDIQSVIITQPLNAS